MNDVSQKVSAELDANVVKALAAEQLQAAFSIFSQGTKDTESDKSFQDFLKEEYRNIAAAHFNAGTTINQFFQFYLLIIGIPVTGAGVLARFGGQAFDIGNVLAQPITSILAAAIAVSGVCMMAHLINLRLEALHYARAVNGIRKYFYKLAKMDVRDELSMRGLPRTITQPRYWEPLRFGWIIAGFGILDGVYSLVPAWILTGWLDISQSADIHLGLTGGCFAAFVLMHFLIYRGLAWHHETHYLRTHVIGLDIDGVISNHREAFCNTLYAATQQTLSPESISKIPVHECETLRDLHGNRVAVVQQDEYRVFNRSDYWTTMPVYPLAPTVLRELRETFHFRLILFTHRPWPNPGQYQGTMPVDPSLSWKRLFSPRSWLSECRPFTRDTGQSWLGWVKRKLNGFLEWCRQKPITRITEKWLQDRGIAYDRLVVERGNVHVADPRSKGRNRFRLAEELEIRVFVDDDLAKARKLAEICEVVYLIDQPYNQADDLPNNLIRVGKWNDSTRDAWAELKRHIRENL